jgi:GNAT superfamily N-acetyltransferase
MPSILRTHSQNTHFISLVDELNALLRIVDGDKHEFYNQFNQIDAIPYVLIAYEDDKPVACGAMKEYNKTTVEIKRMFTKLEVRGKGLGKTILRELENWAKELGYQTLLLETGISFKVAISLYEKYGFEHIPNYDQYIGQKDSVCFQKEIV